MWALRRSLAFAALVLAAASSSGQTPINDSCSGAIPITDGTVTGTTIGSTNSINSCGLSGLAPDVWYSYTAVSTGLLSLSTCGSSFDTTISLFASCTSILQLTCNDDAPQGAPCGYQTPDSYLTYPVTAGQTLKIRVAGFIGAQGTFVLTAATRAGHAYCLGDGVSATICPCANTVSSGTPSGCRNSMGVGATLDATGVASVSSDALVLYVDNVPFGTSVLFFQGTTKQASGYGSSFGDGVRCVGGTGVRLAVRPAPNGNVRYPLTGEPRISLAGQVPGFGGERFYQAWYRNSGNYCTLATFNLTNGFDVVWLP